MSPSEKLKNFIISYVNENNLEEHLKNEVPRKWEKYGDFVLFDERTFCSEAWKCQGRSFWEKIAEILKCKRVAVKKKITNDDFRTPNVTILLGEDPWILHKDNAILYTWNLEKSMFSAGNASERHRIANQNCENEVVVDLFAGIGYFTLPFIIHAKAKFVHACEWNPAAAEALKRNLVLNKVQNKCSIYEGDNRLACPKNIGNRINLGLIPSSENYWTLALEALVEEGGMLHIHENVETKKFEILCKDCFLLSSQINLDDCKKNLTFIQSKIKLGEIDIHWKHKQWLLKGIHILHSLNGILLHLRSTRIWFCTIVHLNYVKSYAPKVHHIVYDVKVQGCTSV